ncbi:MAG TPA: murein biosynthesis integral membrane protein MurJ [Firmicutes bacterium]|nr:murein biosynthesis integral membrane protein MurJ [Bacillota bacterium]
MATESREKVAKAAGIVMFAILISRILGFLRERAIAEVFGRTGTTDVFFAAFALPDLMYQLLVGGALSSAFIPVFTQYLARGEEEEAWYAASVFLNLTVLSLLLIMILGVIFTPVLAPLVGIGFSGGQRELLITLMRVTFPAVFFTALSGLAMGVLHSYQKFTLPALGPIIYNLGQILGAYLLGPIIGIMGMAIGTVLGAVGSFSIQFPAVYRRAGYYRPLLDLKHPGIRRMGQLMLPAVVGLSIAQINVIIGQNLASTLETGSIVALRLANRLINFPLGVFAMGISTAIFPTLSRLMAQGEVGEFKKTLSFGLRVVFFITLPSALGMALLRNPIVRLLFESGEFTVLDSRATAFALLFYAPGLLAQAAVQVTTRGYYSLQDTVTPVKIGVITVAANFLFSLAFLKWTTLGPGGLALAFSLSSFLNMALASAILRKKLGGLAGRELLKTVAKAGLAALVMSLAVYYTAGHLGEMLNTNSKMGQLLQVFVSIGAGALVYLSCAIVLKMAEVRFIWDLIKRRIKRKTPKKGLQ